MRRGFVFSLLLTVLATVSSASMAATAVESVNGSVSVPQVSSQQILGDKIDLNGADAYTLQRGLSGVGEAKANAIVAYREANGPFESVDELLEVKGIGKSILDRNRDKLLVK